MTFGFRILSLPIVDHYDLTAWILWAVLAAVVLGVVAVGLLLQISSQNQKLMDQKRRRKSEKKVIKKDCVEQKGQYFGWLKDLTRDLGDRFMVPENCLSCPDKIKCLGTKRKWRR